MLCGCQSPSSNPEKALLGPYPHFSMGISKPGAIVVNGDGNRFANESLQYQDFGRESFAAGVRKKYLIGDRRHLRRYGMGVALPAPYPILNAR